MDRLEDLKDRFETSAGSFVASEDGLALVNVVEAAKAFFTKLSNSKNYDVSAAGGQWLDMQQALDPFTS